jgi:hypothetical protein
VGGIQCRSGRSAEQNTLSSPYENRTTILLLLSLWSSHYTDRVRGAREQFGRRYSLACSQLAYRCRAYFYKSVLFYLKTRTVHNKPVLLLPNVKCAYRITKNIISASQNKTLLPCPVVQRSSISLSTCLHLGLLVIARDVMGTIMNKGCQHRYNKSSQRI